MNAATLPLMARCPVEAIDEERLADAAACVRRGGLVAFPTETVYGIAAHAWDRAAVERLYRLKGRPAEKRLTLHLWDRAQAQVFAREIPPAAQRLMDALWPGPLTIILPGRETPTVGLRLPAHPVAQCFLRLCQVPVVAPSANRSGAAESTEAAQALDALDEGLDIVIDSGATTYGRPSTVVDATVTPLRIVREGVIARRQIESLGMPCA